MNIIHSGLIKDGRDRIISVFAADLAVTAGNAGVDLAGQRITIPFCIAHEISDDITNSKKDKYSKKQRND